MSSSYVVILHNILRILLLSDDREKWYVTSPNFV